MTPVDRISIKVPADSRLSPVVRTAVLLEAKRCGMPQAQAQPLAREAAKRFQLLASSKANSRPSLLSLSIEPLPGELLVRLGFERGGRGAVLRGRLPRPRRGHSASIRMGGRRHPSV